MNPFGILRICWVLAKVPISLLWVFGMNVANFVAPDWTFKMIQKKMKMTGINKPFESTSDLGFMFSLDLVKLSARGNIRDILKEAQVGSPAPNPTLVNLSSKSSTTLLSLAKAGRPMVVNFGSCT
eukprot:TRINITY_DN30348_c0_g1_i1.p2 TRINITY_DN30348_c0_g1~~TRINITY_DN30348_c0_g1_i1.p2  ORF type:complete len:125 (+),score=21.01 TRINITY_DN30348_c0_g1_i1:74-448(+)